MPLSSTTTSYWAGAILPRQGDLANLAKVRELAGTLIAGQTRTAQLEKLKGSGALCVRANQSDRVLFTTVTLDGEAYLLFLEYIDNHRYDHSAFKTRQQIDAAKAQIIAEFNHDRQAFINSRVSQCDCANDNSDDVLPQVDIMSHYKDHFIALDDKQLAILDHGLPAIVTGAAGSGKSCLAYMQLLKHVQHNPGSGDKVLYITRNKRLVDDMRALWLASLDVPNKHNVEVTFVDYASYIKSHINAEATGKTIVAEDVFLSWAHTKRVEIDGIDLNTVYQEFQQLAVCDKRQSYLVLGKKRCLVYDEERKQRVWDLFEQYEKYLTANDFVDTRLTKIAELVPSYQRVIVDEAQDFAPAELDVLSQLAENHQHCFFMDSNQGLNANVPKRPFLAALLSKQLYKPVPQYTLQTTYRNSKAVLAIANAVLKLKNYILGGKPDKAEYTQSNAVANQAIGAASWVDCGNQSDIQIVKTRASSANCAIVIADESMRAEAKAQFNSPLIFTVEEIKGLEFDDIILYKFLSQPAYVEVSRKTPAVDVLASYELKGNRPKSNENIALNTAFNRLFTAITRAKNRCHVVEKAKNHKLKNLYQFVQSRLSKIATPGHVNATKSATLSTDEWARRADEMIRHNNLRQARDIFASRLGMDVRHLTSQSNQQKYFETLRRFLNPSVSVASSGSSSTSSSAGVGVAQDKPKEDKPKEDKPKEDKPKEDKPKLNRYEVYVEGFIKDIKGNLEKLLNKPKQVNRILETIIPSKGISLIQYLQQNENAIADLSTPGCIKTLSRLDTNIILLSKMSCKVLARLLNTNYKETYSSELDLVYSSSLFLFVRHSVGLKLLCCILRRKPALAKSISISQLTRMIADPVIGGGQQFTSPLYWLTASLDGIEVLSILLDQNPALFTLLTAEQLSCPLVNPESGPSQFVSPLLQLTATPSGRAFLTKLFDLNSTLLDTLTVEQLTRSCDNPESARNQYTSPLYWLSMFSDGHKILAKLLAQNSRFAKSVTVEQLTRSLDNSLSGESQFTSPLLWLSGSPSGRKVLATLLAQNPKLASSITAAQLTRSLDNPQSGRKQFASPLYYLSCSPAGCEILATLLAQNPRLATSITAAQLRRSLDNPQSGGNQFASPLYYLSGSFAGRKVLATILAQNSKLASSITASQLTRPLDNPLSGGEQFASPLYWLSSSPSGCKILATLLAQNPKLASSITASQLTRSLDNPQSGRNQFASPLYWLAGSFAGRKVLAILLAQNPKLASSITAAQLTRSLDNPQSGRNQFTSPLYWLAGSSAGREILATLLAQNPKLASSITAAQLTRSLDNPQSGKKQFASPLYWLAGSFAGRKVLATLLAQNPKLARSITASQLTRSLDNPQSDEKQFTSPLLGLSGTSAGCKILATLLAQNPKLASSITAEHLTKAAFNDKASSLSSLTMCDDSIHLLSSILAANPSIAPLLTTSQLFLGYSKPRHSLQLRASSSPFSRLASSVAGQTLLLFILRNNDRIIEGMTTEQWRSVRKVIGVRLEESDVGRAILKLVRAKAKINIDGLGGNLWARPKRVSKNRSGLFKSASANDDVAVSTPANNVPRTRP